MQSKQQKRIDAKERNDKWASLTPEQQLASLKTRRGESRKQISKINARAEADRKKKK